DTETANVNLSVPLFAPGRWRNWGHAEDNVIVAGASAEEVRRQVALATGHAWLAVAANRRLLDVDRRARDVASAHVDYASTRFHGGLGNKVDWVRAQTTLANAETLLASAQVGLVRAQEALGVLLGAEGPVDASGAEVPEPPPLADALRGAMEKRADVRAFELRRKVAHSVANDAWTDYVPYVSGSFQPFYQNPPSLTQPKTGWQAQLLLTWMLYDGGLRYGVEREHRLLAHEADVTLEGTQRQARSEVRGGEETVRAADAAVTAAREAARLAHEQLELANLAYHAGATTNLDVIDAERTALDADTQAEIAEDNARQARLDLLAASGRFP
ncbi:MAG TPA: TolC family protein, partial [bacterium]|nr:TolC family protein [bacterium]